MIQEHQPAATDTPIKFGDHKAHEVVVEPDGTHKCECGESWPREVPMTVQVQEYDVVGMSAHHRCDRCGGQAYGEAWVGDKALLFCAHHLTEHMPRLKEIAHTIHDHRKFLLRQEKH